MVDIYKKILVNQYDEKEPEETSKLPVEKDSWMSQLSINEENVLYGSGKARILDFGLFDEKGNVTGLILKKSTFEIKIKVQFEEDVEYPIFAFTIKNARGAEVTGTNSMF